MSNHRRTSLFVGLFVVASLLVGSVLLMMLGQRSGILRPRYTLVTYFEDVQGLVAGAPVRLAGKDVGRVESVQFAPANAEVPPVRVVIQVDASVDAYVRSDSVASIGTVGLLGDRYVSVSMGTGAGRVLEEGQELASVSPVDLDAIVVRGTQAIDSAATLADNVNRVVLELSEAMGDGRLDQTTESIARISSGVAELTEEVRGGDGLLHSLIYDNYEGGGVESVERSLARLEQIMEQIVVGDGLLHQLIYDDPEGEAFAEAVAGLQRLNAILEKIDGGTGTIGLLVNDPSLYHDLQVLVGGAQRSLLVRSLVRMSAGSP